MKMSEARPSAAAREPNAALVIDRNSGLFGDRVLDVVDGNVTTEDRPRIRVGPLDGHDGEADERRIARRTSPQKGNLGKTQMNLHQVA